MALATSSKVPGQKSDRMLIDEVPKRFAYLPMYITQAEFDALDATSRKELLEAIDDQKAEKWNDGYLYPDLAYGEIVYIENKGYFFYEPSWNLDSAKLKSQPGTRYCVVVIEYKTNQQGEVIELSEDKRPVLSDGTKVPFDYDTKFLTLSMTQFKTWQKQWTKEYNPVATDFMVSKEKKKGSSPTFSPARTCYWRNHGKALMEQIIRDGRPKIKEALSKLGRKMDLDRFKEEVLGQQHSTPMSNEEESKYGAFMSNNQ